MKTTQNLEMKIPEGGDPIDITDITGNFEKLDTEIAKKANASGGDISAMAVKTLDTIATEFPVPSAGESSKTFLGKVRKFVQDFNNFKTGILTLGRLVNNGQTTEPGFALDARYGRTLYELYAQLNADLGNLYSNLATLSGKVGTSNVLMTNGYAATETVANIAGKFSDYRFITFMAIWDSSQFVDVMTLPLSAFVGTTGGVSYLKTTDGTQTISIRYESDTSVKILCSSTYLSLRIIGALAK